MNTSTLLFAQMASTTGQFIEDSLPLLWLVIGLVVAMYGILVIARSILTAGKIIKGRRK